MACAQWPRLLKTLFWLSYHLLLAEEHVKMSYWLICQRITQRQLAEAKQPNVKSLAGLELSQQCPKNVKKIWWWYLGWVTACKMSCPLSNSVMLTIIWIWGFVDKDFILVVHNQTRFFNVVQVQKRKKTPQEIYQETNYWELSKGSIFILRIIVENVFILSLFLF